MYSIYSLLYYAWWLPANRAMYSITMLKFVEAKSKSPKDAAEQEPLLDAAWLCPSETCRLAKHAPAPRRNLHQAEPDRRKTRWYQGMWEEESVVVVVRILTVQTDDGAMPRNSRSGSGYFPSCGSLVGALGAPIWCHRQWMSVVAGEFTAGNCAKRAEGWGGRR